MRAGARAGMMIVGDRLGIRLADHDRPGPGQLLQVECAHGLDEGVHLGGIRSDLEQQPRVRPVGNSRPVLAGYSLDIGGVTVDFDHSKRSLAHERVPAPELGHAHDVDETRELLEHLVHVHGFDDEHHPARARPLARADDKARHVPVATPDQSHRAVQRARTVVQLHYYGMLPRSGPGPEDRRRERVGLGHRRFPPPPAAPAGSLCAALVVGSISMSPMLCPCGTMGKTFASRSTLKSITTTPGVSHASSIARSASSAVSTVTPFTPYASANFAKSGPESGVPL